MNQSDTELARRLRSIKQCDEFNKTEIESHIDIATIGGRFDPDLFRQVSDGAYKDNKRNFESIKSVLISNKKSQEIFTPWTILSNQIQTFADTFTTHESMNFEDKNILILKNKAKIALLERCRQTLWLCQTIWCRMTSRDEPTPLKAIDLESITQGAPPSKLHPNKG